MEDDFRLTKDEDQVYLRPFRHWTDSRIRCHIFTSMAAPALLRIIELRLRRSGLDITAKTAMPQMQKLHSCLLWLPKKRKAPRMPAEPNEMQDQITRPFGWKISGGVLQEIKKYPIDFVHFLKATVTLPTNSNPTVGRSFRQTPRVDIVNVLNHWSPRPCRSSITVFDRRL